MTAIPWRPDRSMRRGERLGLVRLHERIAMGTTSAVHFGWHVRGHRLVVVKRLHPQHVADEVAIAGVRDEARIAMRVDHPNVVATLGVVRHPGELLAVTEYVPGASLAEIAREASGGLDPQVACAILAGALRGIQASHEARAGIPLRELSCISPGRVLVGDDGRSRSIDVDVPGPMTAAAIERQLPYASPEQLAGGGGVDERRDVYAAAVVLWETLTGRSLFRALTRPMPTVEQTLRKILSEPVPAPSCFAPRVDPRLDAIVLRGLARNRSDRFASASAMANELEHMSHASISEVARAIARLDLACIRQRSFTAEAINRREHGALHIECTRSASKE